MDKVIRASLVVDYEGLSVPEYESYIKRTENILNLIILCNNPKSQIGSKNNAVIIRNTGNKPREDFIVNAIDVIRDLSNLEPVVYLTVWPDLDESRLEDKICWINASAS